MTEIAPSSEHNNEREWVVRAQAGDKAAYGLLVQRYQRLIVSVAYRQGLDLASAEDVAQETFVKAWLALPRFRESAGSWRAWLCRIAINAATDALRHDRPSEELAERVPDDDGGPAHGRRHELHVHGPHALLVLADDAVHRAPALHQVAPQAADEAHVGVGVDEQRDVHQLTQLGVGEDEDALEHDDEVLADVAGLVEAAVLGVVVDGLFDRLARQQLAHVAPEQLVVEGVGVIEVARLPVAQGDVLEVLVVGILVDDDDPVGPEIAHHVPRDEGLAGTRPAGDPDEDAWRHRDRNLPSVSREGQRGARRAATRHSAPARPSG